MDKYFGDTTNVNFGRLTATISIELKYHSTQKAFYRIERGFIHILSGHVLESIATRIFYGFLNIYKILRLLKKYDKILSDFKGLKSHPIHNF